MQLAVTSNCPVVGKTLTTATQRRGRENTKHVATRLSNKQHKCKRAREMDMAKKKYIKKTLSTPDGSLYFDSSLHFNSSSETMLPLEDDESKGPSIMPSF